MKKLLLILISVPVFCYAQAPTIEWQQTYGGTLAENGSLVRPTSDGGYIMIGFANSSDGDITSNNGGPDYWVVKTDALGNIQWQDTYGGLASDQGYDINETSDGGYILTGSSNSTNADVLPGSHGALDYWVVKLNSAGVIQWQKSLGGVGVEIGFRIVETLDGGYAVTGLSSSNGTGDVTGPVFGGQDYWFCKLDVSGNIQWQKNFGGGGTEQCFDFVQNADSTYVICGFSGSPNTGMVTGNHGSNDYWIIKISSTGNLIWEKSYGGTGSDRAFNISKTSDGGYIVNGTTASNDGDVTGYNGGIFDYWVVKLDGNGDMDWQRTLGGSLEDFGRTVYETMDGGYLVAGRSESTDGDVTGNHGLFDYWLVKLDATGNNIQWQQSYGGSLQESAPPTLNVFMNAMEMADGKIIMMGYTFSTNGDASGNTASDAFDSNYWLVKLNACPAYTGISDSICSGDTYNFNSMLLTSSGTYYDTLSTLGGCDSIVTLQLEVSPPATSPVINDTICNGDTYLFNSEFLTSSGTYYDTLTNASGCDSIITLQLFERPAINPVITPSGNDLSTGAYATYQWLLNGGTIPAATGQNYTILQGGLYSVIVVDIHGCIDTSATYLSTLGIDNAYLGNTRIYPNPIRDHVTIQLPEGAGMIELSLYSMDGKKLKTAMVNNGTYIVMEMIHYQPGVYLLRIEDTEGNEVFKKLVKE